MHRSLSAAGFMLVALLPACAAGVGGGARPGSSPRGDKSSYHLFNPTPRQQWRPMSSDRPDVTESPITVDAGAMQAETSFVDVTTAGGDRTVRAMSTNYKVGITNNMDLQVVFDPYVRAQDGPVDSDGFGLTQLRWKINLWGNDDDGSALGILPFVQAPTAAAGLGSDKVEGGLCVPFSMPLSEGMDLGVMLQGGAAYDELDGEHDLEFVGTVVLSRSVTDALAGYVESISVVGDDSDAGFRQTIGAGLTYACSPDVVFDVGTNVGVTDDDTDDANVFAGVTWRF